MIPKSTKERKKEDKGSKKYQNRPRDHKAVTKRPKNTKIPKSTKGTEGMKDLEDPKPKKTKRLESLCLPFSVYPKLILVPI